MTENPQGERRQYYRLRYPIAARPTIACDDKTYQVREISEGGARIVVTHRIFARNEEPFSGVIQFSDGEQQAVEGCIIQNDEKEFVVNLSKGISLQRMIKEQHWLRKSYLMPPADSDSGNSS